MGNLFMKNIVIMDGSNWDTLNAVVSIVRMMTSDRKSVSLERLDEDHPTVKVLKFRESQKRFDEIQEVIEECWPGLCNFNVAV